MAIDRAMGYELAEEWFPPFLAATQMNASHPLREAAFAQAETAVYDSYLAQAEATAEGGSLNDAYQETAADVVEVLRGVAEWMCGQEARS